MPAQITNRSGKTKLKIEVGPQWTIAALAYNPPPGPKRGWCGFFSPYLERLKSGRLLLGFVENPDHSRLYPVFRCMRIHSDDNGQSWRIDGMEFSYLSYPVEMKDGFIQMFYAFTGEDGRYPIRQGDSYIGTRYLSYDNALTWIGPEKIFIHIPQARDWHFGRSFIELPDGRLINANYTQFEGDEKRHYDNIGEGCRVVIVISEDKGKHWEYLSTVACDHLTEPALLLLPSGRLVCVMRTQSFKPMMQSFSDDLGKTWTEPEETGVVGVWPDLCLMESGVVACSYGRPKNNIMFSLDGTCKKWTNHTIVMDTPTEMAFAGEIATGGCYSHEYTAIREIRPDELLYIYDIDEQPQEWHGGPLPRTKEELIKATSLPTLNTIRAALIRVTKGE